MDLLLDWLTGPWPWYVAGPIIGAMVPLMLLIGNRSFGVSINLRHLCAMGTPKQAKIEFFSYEWRDSSWSLVYALGVVVGGYLAAVVFANPDPVALSEAAKSLFAEWGLATPTGLVPPEMFALNAYTVQVLLGSGFLIGFGARYAGGCTSGHAITGLATLQPQSLIAVLGIFAGGLFASHVLLGMVI